MLYCDRIDTKEGNDLTKSNRCKECMICHHWLFSHGFKFEDYVCNGCHGLSLLKMLIILVLFITLANLRELFY